MRLLKNYVKDAKILNNIASLLYFYLFFTFSLNSEGNIFSGF